jgi:hypothetical protein
MRVVKESTALGKKLVERGSRYEGTSLNQIYDKWSSAKQRAFDWCYDQYLASEEHEAFSIISHNSFGFSVSWICKDGLRIETPKK